ncbi:hypothetical protein [Mucilaginibacter lappiensis]|uniref:Uncharacterized protein n=1 Tax=Mucilaginibacter lappiensis TaxID=354630 RepID=A0A841JLI8_9SPHI|nr:hypothetical protein [Mucilaginibacter lappiensis]MBB6131324.1 hypothetical protein [Mucilaginibacter lappiensis]
MYIRADQSGNIQLVSKYDNVDCVYYTGVFPDDFFATLGLGKYIFLNGQITAVEGWVMPDIKPL